MYDHIRHVHLERDGSKCKEDSRQDLSLSTVEKGAAENSRLSFGMYFRMKVSCCSSHFATTDVEAPAPLDAGHA